MDTKLIIGCKSCFKEIKEKRGYTITNKGLLQTPLVVNTGYTINDLYELFLQNYTCPYCQETLIITPKIMEFVNDFIDKKYHIVYSPESTEIINDQENLCIDKEKQVEDIKDYLLGKDYEYYPTIDEMKVILNVRGDIDFSKWFFYMTSAYTQKPYFIKHHH